jgi:hypothetical protein
VLRLALAYRWPRSAARAAQALMRRAGRGRPGPDHVEGRS